MNRRLFLIGSAAALAVASVPKLIIPARAEHVTHLALSPDTLVRARLIVGISAGVNVPMVPEQFRKRALIRIGRPEQEVPIILMSLNAGAAFHWWPNPDAFIALRRESPLLYLEWEDVPAQGSWIDVSYVDVYVDNFERAWTQEFRFPCNRPPDEPRPLERMAL